MTRRHAGSRVLRLGRACVLTVVAALALLLLGAGPASAHATVQSTSPAQGSQVATAPETVAVTFDEAVGISAGSIKVVGPHGRVVGPGGAVHPGGDARTVSVRLVPNLARGSYLVVWHVVSDDSHPVAGTFTFGYGVPAGPASAPPSADAWPGALRRAADFGALAGTVVLLGGAFFFSVLWPRGWMLTRSRRLLTGAWAAAFAGTVVLFVVEGPYGASLPLAEVLDGSLLGITFGTIYGKLLLLRLLALAGAALVWRAARKQARAPSRWDLAGLALLVIESFSFAGHAGQGSSVPLASSMVAIHLAAASVWLGGLVVLGSALLPTSVDAATLADLGAVLPRWSRTALSAVAALVLTGVYQAWREVGGWAALAATGYGRLVLGKVVVLTVMLALAWYGRRWVLRHVGSARVATARDVTGSPGIPRGRAVPGREGAGAAAAVGGIRGAQGAPTTAALYTAEASRGSVLMRASGPSTPEPGPVRLATLRRSVVAEAALGAVVLALTAALVNAVPARQAYVPAFTTSLVARSLAGDTVRVDVAVRPTTPGYEGISVRASTPSGRALPLQAATASFTNPARGIGPIELALATGTGRVEDALVNVPSPGWWRVALRLRVNGSAYVATTGYSVG